MNRHLSRAQVIHETPTERVVYHKAQARIIVSEEDTEAHAIIYDQRNNVLLDVQAPKLVHVRRGREWDLVNEDGTLVLKIEWVRGCKCGGTTTERFALATDA